MKIEKKPEKQPLHKYTQRIWDKQTLKRFKKALKDTKVQQSRLLEYLLEKSYPQL